MATIDQINANIEDVIMLAGRKWTEPNTGYFRLYLDVKKTYDFIGIKVFYNSKGAIENIKLNGESISTRELTLITVGIENLYYNESTKKWGANTGHNTRIKNFIRRCSENTLKKIHDRIESSSLQRRGSDRFTA